MKRTLLCCLTLLSCPFLYADEDTQLRLNQSLDQTLLQEQRQFHEQGTIRSTEQLPKLQINGQEYSVEQNPNDLAKALYLAVMQKQWLKATVYLEHYKICWLRSGFNRLCRRGSCTFSGSTEIG